MLMVVLAAMVVVVIAIVIVQIVRFVGADSDLTLQWADKYGTKVERLKGQVVWITGASSGIGEYLAYRLAAAGCRLVLSARRKEELDRVQKQCMLTGSLQAGDVMVLPLDMTKFDTHADAAKVVLQHFGQIDILVNNAGRGQRALFANTSLEVDRQMLELNVLGVLSLTKCVLPHMQERRKGHVVVTSSVLGIMGAPGSASYVGSKHALQGWFKVVRTEGRAFNLDVTLLCPGPIFSGIGKAAFTDTPGEVNGVNDNPSSKRMATDRCAHLCAVAIANRLCEAWVSEHPVLLAVYLAQYMPSLYFGMLEKILLKNLTSTVGYRTK